MEPKINICCYYSAKKLFIFYVGLGVGWCRGGGRRGWTLTFVIDVIGCFYGGVGWRGVGRGVGGTDRDGVNDTFWPTNWLLPKVPADE